MKHFLHFVLAVVTFCHLPLAESAPVDGLCAPLQAFVASVPPNDSREFTLHTIWGENFKDSSEQAISAKRCIHNSYEPAKAVCGFLMEHGATEFAGTNLKRVLECLAPGMRFANVDVQQGSFSLNYGTEDRGSNLKILFTEDAQFGGMALRLVARGY